MDELDRFMAKVSPCPITGCWWWAGAGNLYGEFSAKIRGVQIHRKAHRFSMQRLAGVEPGDLYVLHKCDNPACVNPQHLFLGTAQDNATDMVNKGRSTSGDKNTSRTHPERLRRGSACPASKLTEDQVREIRRRYRAGRGSSRGRSGLEPNSMHGLAREFGLSRGSLRKIVLGLSWKSVT